MGDGRTPACGEADEVAAAGARDAAQAARAQQHQQSCGRCRTRAERLGVVTAAVLHVDDRLDDLARARIGAAVVAGLRDGDRPRRRLVWWTLAPAVAAAGLLLALSLRHPSVEEGPPLATLPLIRPYQATGGSAVAPAQVVGRTFDRLEVPAGTRIRATLGDRARVTLIGPADVRTTAVSPAQMTLELARGTILADYDHRAGGTLVIRSPGLVTEVVGTRFAIEVEGTGSRVSVAHGRVTVRPTDGGAGASIGSGESWATADRTLRPIQATTAASLREHGAEPVTEAPPAPSLAAAPPTRPTAMAPSRPPRTGREPVRRLAARAPSIDVPAVAAPVEVTPPPPETAPPPAPAPLPTPTPAVAPPPAPPPPDPALTASSLYARAETAMSRRDQAESGRLLGQVIASFPEDPLADAARYELAQRAQRAGDHRTAARHAAAIVERGHEPALIEAAEQLGCRVTAEAGDVADARRCFLRFRGRHPQSARDPEALTALVQLAQRANDCDQAVRLVVEYLRRYPQGPFAAAAGKIAESCVAR